MSKITLDLLAEASMPGGASCLTSVTELEPAAGPHASVAPAKFASRTQGDKKGEYAYERRYLDGVPTQAVIIDSKQSQLNRCEAALAQAIADGHPTLSRMPRVEVTYSRDGVDEVYSDLTLPHRIFDGHIRAGTAGGKPVTQLDAYRGIRNATPGNARAVLDASPVSLVFGSWDSSRSARQGRWRSTLVGEIIGFCADDRPSLRGGARVDPVGMRINLTEARLKALADAQRTELSGKNYKTATTAKPKKGEEAISASMLGLGGIPPTLDTLSGVACSRIIRSHVLSFADAAAAAVRRRRGRRRGVPRAAGGARAERPGPVGCRAVPARELRPARAGAGQRRDRPAGRRPACAGGADHRRDGRLAGRGARYRSRAGGRDLERRGPAGDGQPGRSSSARSRTRTRAGS